MSERLVFSRSLYLPEAVEAAAAAYAGHARIEVTRGANETVAVVSDVVEHDPRMLANAFCNHVLHETIAQKRQAELEERT
jgi:hypothetical protein